MISLIITSAGSGKRSGLNYNKIFFPLNGKSVIETTYEKFLKTGKFGEIIITANKEDYEKLSTLFPAAKIVLGGETRTKSIKNALSLVSGDIVLIHDAVRPFVTEEIILSSIESAEKFGSGIAAHPSPDTVCKESGGEITEILGKDNIYIIETPQGFKTDLIKKAYEKVDKEYPDDSAVYSLYIGKPKLSKGSKDNRKLTYKEDFDEPFRIGNGYDTHELVENRKLILGGVEIPHKKGLLGHSDADVLTHAIMDALLSGAGLRDIGYYFPDTDEKYKGISSILLLREVIKLIKENGFKVCNVTASILAQKPKLSPFIDTIKDSLIKELSIDKSNLGITATTTEGLGFIGREEGIAVYSTALLEKIF